MIAFALLLAAEQVLASGGELAGPPEQTLAVAGDQVEAWGFSEVPPKSRLQAALALSDANARAELVKYVKVKVTDALSEKSTLTSEEIESRTQEIARGLLPELPPAQHGWRKLKRGDEIVLQVWSRLTASVARLKELVANK
jgi:hypothetical protein